MHVSTGLARVSAAPLCACLGSAGGQRSLGGCTRVCRQIVSKQSQDVVGTYECTSEVCPRQAHMHSEPSVLRLGLHLGLTVQTPHKLHCLWALRCR